MSNPGVKVLANTKINGMTFCIEDNIGEAMHIHWGNIRLDLTIKEFLELSDKIGQCMNEMVDRNDFDVNAWEPDKLYENAKYLIHDDIAAEEKTVEEFANRQKEILKDQLKNCIGKGLPDYLKGKNVVIKGAGKHTEELLKLWGNQVKICGILANDGKSRGEIPAVTLDNLDSVQAETIVISSYRYRKEMYEDLRHIEGKYEIVDIYKYLEFRNIHINKEFFEFI